MAGSLAEKSTGAREPTVEIPPIEFITLALRCPLCNTEFTSEIPSAGPSVRRDTDLRPHFSSLDPIPSLIHSCPTCRYTAYSQGYREKELEYEGPGELFSLKIGDRLPAGFWAPAEDDAEDLRRWIRRGGLVQEAPPLWEPFGAERYFLGARCYSFVKDDDLLGVGDYYLRASWCARAASNQEFERKCQQEAISRFQEALDAGMAPDPEKPRVVYLAGELSRRSGEFSRAVDFFSQNEALVDSDDEESVFFGKLALRQQVLAIIKSDVNAQIAEDEPELELVREEDE